MVKAETLHQLFLECQNINFDDSYDLIKRAESAEEENFMRMVTDYILQGKQKQGIAEKRF